MAPKDKPNTNPKVDTKPKQDWKQIFIAKYPQFRKILDGGAGEVEARNVFGDDIIDLILDVATNPTQYDFTTQAGLDAFDSKVYATKYYNETANAAKTFDALAEGERMDRVQTNRVKIASEYGVQTIPTFIAFDGAKRLNTNIGAVPLPVIKKLFEE